MCKSQSCTFFFKEHEKVNDIEVPIPVFLRGGGGGASFINVCINEKLTL